jgi:site-specific DNA-cytosine methylase
MLKIIEFFSGIGAYHQALKELDIEHEVVVFQKSIKTQSRPIKYSMGNQSPWRC